MTSVESQIPIPGPGLSPLKVASSESWVGWTKPAHLTLSTSGMGSELIRSVCGGETPKSLISWVLQDKYWGSCLTLEARSIARLAYLDWLRQCVIFPTDNCQRLAKQSNFGT